MHPWCIPDILLLCLIILIIILIDLFWKASWIIKLRMSISWNTRTFFLFFFCFLKHTNAIREFFDGITHESDWGELYHFIFLRSFKTKNKKNDRIFESLLFMKMSDGTLLIFCHWSLLPWTAMNRIRSFCVFRKTLIWSSALIRSGWVWYYGIAETIYYKIFGDDFYCRSSLFWSFELFEMTMWKKKCKKPFNISGGCFFCSPEDDFW